MSPLQAFGAYAETFERAFASDDWSLLDAHFTEDAVYETLAAARTFAEEVGKTCVEVKRDVAGFVSNRLFSALLVEAISLVESGVVSAADLDTVMKLGFGHTMGPLATVDLTGLDVMLNATSNIYRDTADEKFFPPELLQRMVTAGDLGRKTGKGFYTY